ncbi:MAG: hypothetical protein AAF078_05170 [Planctomycetota bacterium]
MSTHYRTKPTRFSWTVVVIGLLVIVNLFTIGELLRVRGMKLPVVQSELEASQAMLGTIWAMLDYENGERRQYKLVVASRGALNAATGEQDGPFEVWSWTYVDWTGGKAAAQAFADAYNRKMRDLHEAAAADEPTE